MTLAELAEDSRTTPSTFARRFTEDVGVNPGRRLIQQRVDRARRLPEATALPAS